MSDLAAIARRTSPSGIRVLRDMARLPGRQMRAAAIHAATRDALATRGLIHLATPPDGIQRARLTDLGRQLLDHLDRGDET